eukprot:GILK01010519.1.p1 GENE.GILK01010519.1~~GILK01010519.1.p1  ORF type:complete len:197 (+),score=36.30 GILK01010519.1:38-592(+)
MDTLEDTPPVRRQDEVTERLCTLRLHLKDQEILRLMTQFNEMKHSAFIAQSSLSNDLLTDHALNMEFKLMQEQIRERDEKIRKLEEDLEAVQFTPASVTGKKLVSKCRALQRENEELGRQISEGAVQKLQAEIALQKQYSNELRNNLKDSQELIEQLSEDVDDMQQTISALQAQLKLKGLSPNM